jgi:hypothetical protein
LERLTLRRQLRDIILTAAAAAALAKVQQVRQLLCQLLRQLLQAMEQVHQVQPPADLLLHRGNDKRSRTQSSFALLLLIRPNIEMALQNS